MGSFLKPFEFTTRIACEGDPELPSCFVVELHVEFTDVGLSHFQFAPHLHLRCVLYDSSYMYVGVLLFGKLEQRLNLVTPPHCLM